MGGGGPGAGLCLDRELGFCWVSSGMGAFLGPEDGPVEPPFHPEGPASFVSGAI